MQLNPGPSSNPLTEIPISGVSLAGAALPAAGRTGLAEVSCEDALAVLKSIGRLELPAGDTALLSDLGSRGLIEFRPHTAFSLSTAETATREQNQELVRRLSLEKSDLGARLTIHRDENSGFWNGLVLFVTGKLAETAAIGKRLEASITETGEKLEASNERLSILAKREAALRLERQNYGEGPESLGHWRPAAASNRLLQFLQAYGDSIRGLPFEQFERGSAALGSTISQLFEQREEIEQRLKTAGFPEPLARDAALAAVSSGKPDGFAERMVEVSRELAAAPFPHEGFSRLLLSFTLAPGEPKLLVKDLESLVSAAKGAGIEQDENLPVKLCALASVEPAGGAAERIEKLRGLTERAESICQEIGAPIQLAQSIALSAAKRPDSDEYLTRFGECYQHLTSVNFQTGPILARASLLLAASGNAEAAAGKFVETYEGMVRKWGNSSDLYLPAAMLSPIGGAIDAHCMIIEDLGGRLMKSGYDTDVIGKATKLLRRTWIDVVHDAAKPANDDELPHADGSHGANAGDSDSLGAGADVDDDHSLLTTVGLLFLASELLDTDAEDGGSVENHADLSELDADVDVDQGNDADADADGGDAGDGGDGGSDGGGDGGD